MGNALLRTKASEDEQELNKPITTREKWRKRTLTHAVSGFFT